MTSKRRQCGSARGTERMFEGIQRNLRGVEAGTSLVLIQQRQSFGESVSQHIDSRMFLHGVERLYGGENHCRRGSHGLSTEPSCQTVCSVIIRW
ncbi:hypothetical protein L218DRAFT_621387 [Marasmius fiardii PR-910]|nr:hypothetical protein L218DRAFT_621387 [Marasmius fiardii PR-910]